MLDMGSAANEAKRRYTLALEDMLAVRLLTAFVTKHLPPNLGRLPGTVRDLLVSFEAWLRVERQLGSSSS